MRACLLLIACLAILSPARAGEQDEARSFKNANVGQVSLTAPKNWKGIERHHITYGTTFYRLVPPTEGLFDLEILVNDLVHVEMSALVDRDLEIYMQSNMADAAPHSVEGRVNPVRFGAGKDAVYARLTDKAPKPGEFVYFTQGVRLQGQKVVLFTLYSNDRDGAILNKTLAIVDSVKFVQ
jgi:hypothetical protein